MLNAVRSSQCRVILLPLLLALFWAWPRPVEGGYIASAEATIGDRRLGPVERVTDRQVDGGPGFTSAEASASAAHPDGAGAGNARARSLLAGGTVAVFAEAEGLSSSFAEARILDTLFFSAPDSTQSIDVHVGFAVTGQLEGGFSPDNPNNRYIAFASTPQTGEGFDVGMGPGGKDGVLRSAIFGGTITLTRNFDGTFDPVTVSQRLEVGGWEGTADFSHTGAISLELQPGITFTSESGVFLSEQANVIPEPSSLALLSIGGIGMAFGRYR